MKEYPIGTYQRAELETRFKAHKTDADQAERMFMIRDAAKDMAEIILLYTPVSREQSTALTHLEEAVFQANAAIARRENEA